MLDPNSIKTNRDFVIKTSTKIFRDQAYKTNMLKGMDLDSIGRDIMKVLKEKIPQIGGYKGQGGYKLKNELAIEVAKQMEIINKVSKKGNWKEVVVHLMRWDRKLGKEGIDKLIGQVEDFNFIKAVERFRAHLGRVSKGIRTDKWEMKGRWAEWTEGKKCRSLIILAEIDRVRRNARALRLQKEGMGAYVMPWAKETYKLGKPIRKADPGLLALRTPENHIVTGIEKDQVQLNYVKKMWGTTMNLKTLNKFTFSKQITTSSKENMDKDISKEEILKHTKMLKQGKSPGTDGIPAEVWKYWPEELYQILADNFTLILNGKLNVPKSWKESEIKWIFKHNGSPLEISNYRPIALGNSLGKLFMRIMTDRLERVIEEDGIVASEQMGFRTDRSCQGATLILQVMIDRANRNNSPFWWAGLDISKAYDTVNHEALWRILEKKGIGGLWLNTLKSIYDENKIRSITTDGCSSWVKVKKGIRLRRREGIRK